MEPDAADPPDQPAQQADDRHGSRSLFSKFPAEESAGGADIPSTGDTGRTGETSDAANSPRAGKSTGEPAPDSARAASGTTGSATRAGTATTATRAPRKGPGQPPGQDAEVPSRLQQRAHTKGNRALASSLNARPLRSRPLVNPHLRSDPRLNVRITRTIVAVVCFVGFTIGLNWRIGLTAAVIYIAADSIFRSRTTVVVPAGVRITSAQRFTRRRLRVLQPAGYLALHARTIPGTKHVIDHVVVGPAGVFTLDSQRLDRRLPLRAIDGMLYHGKDSLEPRFEHATHESKHAANLIAAELRLRVRVRPAMVMYGPNIPWVIMRFKGVDVFDGSRVGTYFRRQTKAVAEHRLSPSQIAKVLAAAAKALPPLE